MLLLLLPLMLGLSVEHTCDNFEVSVLFLSPVVSLFARLFRKVPTSSTACDLKLLTQFQVSDLKEYADYLICCVLCVSRIYISMNFCLSAGSLWCLAPHSSVFGSFKLIHHQLSVFKGFAVFPAMYPNGFHFMLCSAPIDNLHFLVCVNCSAAQWVLCVTVENAPDDVNIRVSVLVVAVFQVGTLRLAHESDSQTWGDISRWLF